MTKKSDRIRQRRSANFTARASEIEFFSKLLPADSDLDTEILVVYGIGGIGKSELLNQFMRVAAEQGVATARIDPQVHSSIYGFITAIYEQLKTIVSFPRLEDGFKRHQEIENKLVGKSEIPKTALRLFAKSAHVALKLVPGASVVAEVVEPGQIEAAMSAIYGAIGRKDGDFWMKPEEELTERLVADLGAYSAEERLVILVDTYEIIGDFDSWVRDSLFANLEDYAILVIAGRRRLEGKQWQEYATTMRQIELKPLSDVEANAYLVEKRGIENAQVVAAMVDYADGHPLTLAMLADLADQIQIDDLSRIPERRQVLRSVIDRVTQNVATNMRAALEACAILRVVNQDNLAYLLDAPHVDAIFDELQRFEFMKLRDDGIALHDAVRAAMNEEMRWQSPVRYRELNEKAAEYYGNILARDSQGDVELWRLEFLYHSVCANEETGIQSFQKVAAELTKYRLVKRLAALLGDATTYPLEMEGSRLWREYYNLRLRHLQVRRDQLDGLLAGYKKVIDDSKSDRMLRAYAMSDWADLACDREFRTREHILEDALAMIENCHKVAPEIDEKLAEGFGIKSNILHQLGRWSEAAASLDQLNAYMEERCNLYGQASALSRIKGLSALRGDWPRYLSAHRSGVDLFQHDHSDKLLYADILSHWGPVFAWMGRSSEGENYQRQALAIMQRIGDVPMLGPLRDLALLLVYQDKYEEADRYFEQDRQRHTVVGWEGSLSATTGQRFQSIMWIRQGYPERASAQLEQVLAVVQEAQYIGPSGELFTWTGLAYELQGVSEKASFNYKESLKHPGRQYHESAARQGLIRLKAGGEANALFSLTADSVAAEQLAQQYEYNDHLASLRLTQGHIAWAGSLDAWGVGFDAALQHYQHALVYALRFNRFLLDEVLAGRPQGTPLQPIIPSCLTRGDEGRRMLTALADWWQTGVNDVGVPRPATISPLPEGIPLLEAERIAREREPGNGAPQTPVLTQLEHALAG